MFLGGRLLHKIFEERKIFGINFDSCNQYPEYVCARDVGPYYGLELPLSALQIGAGALCGALWVSPLGGGARAALLLALAAAHALPAALHPALLASRPTLDRDPFRLPYNATSDYDEALYDVL